MGMIVALALLVIGGTAAAADLTVRASLTPQRATVGESITLTIEATGAQNVTAPTLGSVPNFDVRYIGPSTQISIVNGQMNAVVQHRYVLVPSQPGRFTVGPFTIEHQGKAYQTQSFTVEVAAASSAAPGTAARPPGGTGNLRVTLTAPRQEVYVHEKLPVEVGLWVGQVRVGDLQYPTVEADGLSLEKFPEPTQREEIVEGQKFQVVRFQTVAVPLRAGSLALGPAVVRLNVYDRRHGGMRDPFFDQFFQSGRPAEIRSDPLPLTILPLPEGGKPPAFSGAVGRFTMQVDATPTEVVAGDPITLRTRITGVGNLADASAPSLASTTAFRTYAPQPGTPSAGASMDATRSFEQVLIPNDASVRAVPSLRFSYFDPQTRRYETLESQPIALVVRPAPQAPRTDLVTGSAPAGVAGKSDERLGRDIVFIKDDPGDLRSAARGWRTHMAPLGWLPLPLIGFAAACWYDRRRQRLSGDATYARFTRAGRRARQGLRNAMAALEHGDQADFFNTISKTMQHYLAAKLDLPPGGIDTEAVRQQDLSPEVSEDVQKFFATCERIRFTPSAEGDMRSTLDLAGEIVRRLERERRRAPAGGTPARAWTSMAVAALILLGPLPSVVGAGDDPTVSPQTTFFHANTLYTDGNYEAAAREYEQLVAAGRVSANLYFNLGNAYFKAGARGQAILNYERARQLEPSDPDIDANLAYAQSLTGANTCGRSAWERIIFPLAGRVPSLRLARITVVLCSLVLGILALHRLLRQRPRWTLYGAAACALPAVIVGTSLAYQAWNHDARTYAVVIADADTAGRFEPSANGTVHYTVKQGTLVQVLESRSDWVQVARCDGRRAWIPRAAVADL